MSQESTALNYIEHLLSLASAVTGCVSISGFAFLVDIPILIANSAVGLKICAKTAGIKECQSIIKKKKKKKKYNKIIFLAKIKLNNIKILIYLALIDSYVSHNELVLVKIMLKKFNEMKEAIENLKTSIFHQTF